MGLRGYIYVLIATVIWGSMAVAAKLAYGYGISYLTLSFYRGFFFFIFVLLYITKRRTRLDPKLISLGLLYTPTMIISYMATVYYIGASFAAFMINTAPIYVLIISMVLLEEKPTKMKTTALAISLLGVYLLTQPEATNNTLGVLAGLISGISYAMISITTRFYVTKNNYGSGVDVIYQLMFLSFIPIGAANIMLGESFTLTVETFLISLYIGLFPTGIAYYFYGKGLEEIEASKVSIIATFETVAAALMAYLILNELMHPVSYIGGALIIIGITLLSTEELKRYPQRNPITKKPNQKVNIHLSLLMNRS